MVVLQDETCLQIRNLLGEEEYCNFIRKLPDEYFRLQNGSKKTANEAVLSEILHEGQTDVEELVGIVRRFISVMVPA